VYYFCPRGRALALHEDTVRDTTAPNTSRLTALLITPTARMTLIYVSIHGDNCHSCVKNMGQVLQEYEEIIKFPLNSQPALDQARINR
jgi:hypothetical protein